MCSKQRHWCSRSLDIYYAINRMDSSGSRSLLSTLPSQLPASFFKDITKNFSSERELGRSVFGTLYKGVLQDGSFVTVKKLAEDSPRPPDKVFDSEVANLMALRHENILSLVSFCRERTTELVNHNGRYVLVEKLESLLCYQYMPNRTLDKYIYDGNSTISWDMKFRIIKGICQGLRFLHEELDGPLIHMNLVPSSIWLDDNWVPKIADFGFSRIFGQDQTRMNTINVVGPIGYMSPEYLYRGEISTRLDIYSLGMLILEMTTGEKVNSNSEDITARQFVDKVHQNWRRPEQIMDKCPFLDSSRLQQVKVCISIGLKCVEVDRKERPSIVNIVDKLNGKHVPLL